MEKHEKHEQLEQHSADAKDRNLTTNQGVKVSDTDNSLTAGARGPTLMEDFHFREKMTHFDHERIPERVVHVRGSAAHGYFEAYEPLDELTRVRFLCDPSARAPVANRSPFQAKVLNCCGAPASAWSRKPKMASGACTGS
jgi:catalase